MRGEARGLGVYRLARVGASVLLCFLLANCAGSNPRNSNYSPKVVADGEPVPKGGGSYKVGQPYSINGRIYSPSENPSYRSEGIASWYGPDFHGRLTANGEVYDMHGISAAHPTMPLPSYARVTNLENGRSIIVRVNDRGPYARNRVVDLSIGTAKALDFYGRGLARVRVEYVGRAPMDGTDDAMLMATLRTGTPAPAPSRVMVASAKPFLPPRNSRDTLALETGAETRKLAPSERPLTLGPGPTGRRQVRSAVRIPDAEEQFSPPIAPAAAFMPVRNDNSMGVMSGRGLY
jgi:peptidoglycan lytic transglycosylase